MSTTVTVKLQEVSSPAASVTLKVLVVVPTGKIEPEAKPAVCVVVAPEQLSVPTGLVVGYCRTTSSGRVVDRDVGWTTNRRGLVVNYRYGKTAGSF